MDATKAIEALKEILNWLESDSTTTGTPRPCQVESMIIIHLSASIAAYESTI